MKGVAHNTLRYNLLSSTLNSSEVTHARLIFSFLIAYRGQCPRAILQASACQTCDVCESQRSPPASFLRLMDGISTNSSKSRDLQTVLRGTVDKSQGDQRIFSLSEHSPRNRHVPPVSCKPVYVPLCVELPISGLHCIRRNHGFRKTVQ